MNFPANTDLFVRGLRELIGEGALASGDGTAVVSALAVLIGVSPQTSIFLHDPEQGRRCQFLSPELPEQPADEQPRRIAAGLVAAFIMAAEESSFHNEIERWERSTLPWLIVVTRDAVDGTLDRETLLRCYALLRYAARSGRQYSFPYLLAREWGQDRKRGCQLLALALAHHGFGDGEGFVHGIEMVISDLFDLGRDDEQGVVAALAPEGLPRLWAYYRELDELE